MEDLGLHLWNFIIGFLRAMDRVYIWITSPVGIKEFSIFGVTIWEEFTFVPLTIGGPVIVAILAIGVISLLNPFS